jgi:exosortase
MNNQATIGILDQFQTDLMDSWRRLPTKGFFFALLAAWLLLFQLLGNPLMGFVHTPSLYAWMYNAYNSPNTSGDDAIGNFVPFLVLGLLWWKRGELLALPLKMWIPGLLVLIAAMVLHVAGYVLQQPRLSIIALFAGIYGLAGLAWGREWLRNTIFPFFLLAFCIPLGVQADIITFPLRLLVCRLVEVISHSVLAIDVVRRGTELSDPSGAYQYDVVAACSGIRSLFAIFLLNTVYGFVMFRPYWKRLVMMALALPFAILGNLIRLLCIIIAAEIGGRGWGDYVHEGGPFGIISLLPYIPAIIGVLAVGRFLERGEAPAGKARP